MAYPVPVPVLNVSISEFGELYIPRNDDIALWYDCFISVAHAGYAACAFALSVNTIRGFIIDLARNSSVTLGPAVGGTAMSLIEISIADLIRLYMALHSFISES